MTIQIRKAIYLYMFCLTLLLTGCGSANNGATGSEANWEEGQGDLPHQIGNKDAMTVELPNPTYLHHFGMDELLEKIEYGPMTGQWFMHNGAGKFGYGLSSGTMKPGDDYKVSLFGHNPDGEPLNRYIRIQLTTRDKNYERSDLIREDIIHVETVKGEQEIFSHQLPEEENVIYLLSVEIISEDDQVEDTMVSSIYVPTPDMNAALTTNQEVYLASDEQAAILLENFGPTFFSLGTYYTIEKKVENNWKVVPLDYAFNDIGLFLPPRDTYEQTMDISSLTPGHYRVIKQFNVDGLDLSATLAAEFTVE